MSKAKLKKIYVQNFQSIDGYHELNVEAITILVGPNSSGKSAILDLFHALETEISKLYQNRYYFNKYFFSEGMRHGSKILKAGLGFLFKPYLLSYKEAVNMKHYSSGASSDKMSKLFFKKNISAEGDESFDNISNSSKSYRIKYLIEYERDDKRGANSKKIGSYDSFPTFKSFRLSVNDKTLLSVDRKLSVSVNLKNNPFFDLKAYTKKISSLTFPPDIAADIKKGVMKGGLDAAWPDGPSFKGVLESILGVCEIGRSIDVVPASRSIPSITESLHLVPEEDPYGELNLHQNIDWQVYEKLFDTSKDKTRFDGRVRGTADEKFNKLAWSLASKKFFDIGKKFIEEKIYYSCNTCEYNNYVIEAEANYSEWPDDADEPKVNFTDRIQFCPVCGDQVTKETQSDFDYPWMWTEENTDATYYHHTAEKINEYLKNDFFSESGYQVDCEIDFIINSKSLYSSSIHSQKRAKPIVQLFLRDANGNKLEFEDLGSGMAYSLPVLIAASEPEGHHFIQQPELHIHPALQSKFANIFIDSLENYNAINLESPDYLDLGKSYFIETHSEHLILRFLKLIRDKYHKKNNMNFSADDLSILYFEPNAIKNSTSVKQIRVTEDGDFLDKWPNGFFSERNRDIFDE